MAQRSRLLPPLVRAEHLHAEEARMLGLEMCRRAGTPLRVADRLALGEWLRGLAEADEVIEYRPETERGWWRVPRRPDDEDIIRMPEVPWVATGAGGTGHRGSHDDR